MVKSGISWNIVKNTVGDRIVEDSLNHMFTERKKIRKKTQIFNRQIRQEPRMSYKRYVKIRKAILKIVSDDDDTDEDCVSDNDFNNLQKTIDRVSDSDSDSHDEKIRRKKSKKNKGRKTRTKSSSSSEEETEDEFEIDRDDIEKSAESKLHCDENSRFENNEKPETSDENISRNSSDEDNESEFGSKDSEKSFQSEIEHNSPRKNSSEGNESEFDDKNDEEYSGKSFQPEIEHDSSRKNSSDENESEFDDKNDEEYSEKSFPPEIKHDSPRKNLNEGNEGEFDGKYDEEHSEKSFQPEIEYNSPRNSSNEDNESEFDSKNDEKDSEKSFQPENEHNSLRKNSSDENKSEFDGNDDEKHSEKSFQSEIEYNSPGKNSSDEENESEFGGKDEEKLLQHEIVYNSPTPEDIEENLEDSAKLMSIINENSLAPGDSGIDDDDSLDSCLTDSTEINKHQELISKSNDQILKTPKKSKLKITCSEIVKPEHKVKILYDERSNIKNINKNNLDDPSDMEVENNFNQVSLTDSDISRKYKKYKNKKGTLRIPSEIESLQYVLRSLNANNCYKTDFFIDNYCKDKRKDANEPDNHRETDNFVSRRPTDLDELIYNDNLTEIVTQSTLTHEDITEDDEIILMEIPKSMIDNHKLTGKTMRIKKRSVIIDDTRYEVHRKENNDLSCVLKMKENDTDYGIENIVPRASIVVRQKLLPKIESSDLISDFEPMGNHCLPFPKNLKRRNPLLLQPDSNNFKKKKKSKKKC